MNYCMNHKKTTKEYVDICKNVHNNFYDYSKTLYTGAKNIIKYVCPIHGEVEQRADHHLNGHGCSKCNFESQKYKYDDYVEKVNIKHNNFYEYDRNNFNNDKISIKCPIHGVFTQHKSQHLFGQGCPECANDNKRLTKQIFEERSNIVHDFEYDYSKSNYVNNYTDVEIICKKHGSFFQTPNFHMLGQGCPKCKSSKGEKKILKYFELNNIKYEHQKMFNKCKNKNRLPFDFYLPEYNMCVEYNGKQHYEPIDYFGGIETLNYIKNNDQIKETFCKENNIKLHIIKYNDDILEKLKEIKWNIT